MTHLVDESSERCKHMPVGSFRQAHFQEGEVNVKHFLHEWVVTFTVQQLGLGHTHIHVKQVLFELEY